jgi:hypothetical protein
MYAAPAGVMFKLIATKKSSSTLLIRFSKQSIKTSELTMKCLIQKKISKKLLKCSEKPSQPRGESNKIKLIDPSKYLSKIRNKETFSNGSRKKDQESTLLTNCQKVKSKKSIGKFSFVEYQTNWT